MTARKYVWLGVLGLIGVTSTGLLAKTNFFAQPACACGNASQSYAGTFARAQQAHFIEQGEFATAIKDLGINEDWSDANKTLSTVATDIEIEVTETAAFTYAYSTDPVSQRSFVSGVFEVPGTASEASVTDTIICMSPSPETLKPPIDAQTCASGTIQFH